MTFQLQDRFCTLCGPSAGKKVKYKPNFSAADLNAAVFSARRAPDRKHFRLIECAECGIIYSDPACDPSQLPSLYEKSAVTYGSQEEEIYQSYAPVLDRALKLVRGRNSFIEIGGGTGFMLKYGAKHGFKTQTEIEPSADAERKFAPCSPQARFIRGVFKPGTLTPGSASLICFFQMLDHVPNPADFLGMVHEALEPGGVAVCVTHNTHAVSAKVLGERSPIFDIEHTYLFHPKNLARLFEKTGFGGVDSFTVANNYAFRHWLRLAPLPARAKKSVAAVLGGTGLLDRQIRLHAGNFATIGQKP